MTGVSSTAVVSNPSRIVVTVVSTATSRKSTCVRPRVRCAASRAAMSKTIATSASSASTVMATRKCRMGAIRLVTSDVSSHGSRPVNTTATAATEVKSHTSPVGPLRYVLALSNGLL